MLSSKEKEEIRANNEQDLSLPGTNRNQDRDEDLNVISIEQHLDQTPKEGRPNELVFSTNNNNSDNVMLGDSTLIEIDDPELRKLIESEDFVLDEFIVFNDDTPLGNEMSNDQEERLILTDMQSTSYTTVNEFENDIQQSSPVLVQNDRPISDVCAPSTNNVSANLQDVLEEERNDGSSSETDMPGRPKKGRKRKFKDQTREIKKKR